MIPISILMMMVMVLPPLSHADEAQCKSVLQKCDAALTATQQDNNLQRQINADQAKVISDQASLIKEDSIWKPIAEGAIVAALLEALVIGFKK
jgi:hypothetical protein